MEIDSEELTEFVKAVISGIEGGTSRTLYEGYALSAPIRFQIGLSGKKVRGGRLRLSVANMGASKTDEEVARISFEVDIALTTFSKKFDELMKSETGRMVIQNLLKGTQSQATS